MTTSSPARDHHADAIPAAVPWRELAVFLAVTFACITAVGLAWSAFGDLNNESDALLFGGAGMFAPAVGTLVAATVSGSIRRPAQFLAVTGVFPVRPWPRLVGYLALGFAIPVAIMAVSLVIATGAGVFQPARPFPTAVLLTELAVNLATFLPALVLIFGEEWGWGYLLPRLLPLGLWPGIALSGLIWGLFHAPLTMQGYLLPHWPGLLTTLVFTIGSMLLGALMSWIRMASASLWPAVVLHGASNLIANPIPAAVGQSTDPANAYFHTSIPAGWPSWLVIAALVVVLAATGSYRRPYDRMRRHLTTR